MLWSTGNLYIYQHLSFLVLNVFFFFTFIRLYLYVYSFDVGCSTTACQSLCIIEKLLNCVVMLFFFKFLLLKKVVQRVMNRRYNCQNNFLQITDKLYIVFRFAINYVIPDNQQQPTTNYLYLMVIKVFFACILNC